MNTRWKRNKSAALPQAAELCQEKQNRLRRNLSHQKRKVHEPPPDLGGDESSVQTCGGGEPDKVFPHNLRHLFATTFYKACKGIARSVDVLVHFSIETTRIFLLTTGDEHLKYLNRPGLVSSDKICVLSPIAVAEF